jgi:plasmid replication initiation protein
MARRKTEVLEGHLNDAYIVEKSRPLFSLWRSEFTLGEFKILDTYLSRIDSHDPQHRTVRFTKAEFEKLLDVERIRPEALKERLKHLISCQVELDEKKIKGVINLFSSAFVVRDDFEQWQIELSCTPEAMKYFFNIEELGYLRYKLRSIIQITSRFSYVMFMYIEMNRYRKQWTVGVNELKKILCCDDSEFYADFKHFNDKILKYCHKELTEKTELRYTYTPNKVGRMIKDITFTVQDLSDCVPTTANIKQLTDRPQRTDPEPEQQQQYKNADIAFFAEALDNEFSENEVKSLVLIARARCKEGKTKNQRDLAVYNYLLDMYVKLNTYTRVKRRYLYLHKMIENDRQK